MIDDTRTEMVCEIPVHAWSRPSAEGFDVVIRDRSIIYQLTAPGAVSNMGNEAFLDMLFNARCGPGISWPFYGLGITDAGPSPWGWLWDL